MAVQVIPEPKLAYQGSVPGSEAASAGSESAPVVIRAESISDKTAVQAGMDADNENGENGASKILGTETLKRMAEEINRNAKNSEAIFGVHDGTNRITIKIIDKDTKEVIKEYPPEKTLDMIAKVWEMAGLMVDEQR